ncbi:cytochrome P450 family protein [Actinomadura fibrosa]|uniref:Cytochrome P450 n=1 Tax=Actinomadura fibrosa TaxID=111802 RepID=A0ABW2XTC4_9ACTN|nr:cytochrome P450 [Actinomadura fibrosa]
MRLPPEQLPVPGERSVRTVRRLRDEVGPVAPVMLPGGVPAWLVTGHDAITGVLAGDDAVYSKDARNFAALREGRIPADWPMRQVIEGEHLLIKDGADHRRLRALVSRAFTPARVKALEPRVQEVADGLLDGLLAEGDGADLVRRYTGPLPIIVICELFGVPPGERARIRAWTQVLVSHDAPPGEAAAAGAALLAYLAGHVERRRREPADDLTTMLIRARDPDGDRLSGDELRWILWSVIVAGHETTMHLIANAVVALCADRDQLRRVRERGDWGAAVEEALRSRNSVVTTVPRYPLRDVRIAGVEIGAGEAVVVGFGASGTDPAAYGPDAERFDVARTPKPHLGFGRGTHFCLGAPLARLEARIALSTLFTRLPELRLAVPEADLVYTPSIITEGPRALPVLLS